MCFTDNPALADTIKSLRVHGMGKDKYNNVRIGVNGRLDTLQAAILLAKFEAFPEEFELRQQVAGRYTELFSGCPSLVAPHVPDGIRSAWAQYSVLASDEDARSRTLEALKRAGIPTAIYYPKPLHLQEAFAQLEYKPGDFPMSEAQAQRVFSIPMHPYLQETDQQRIVEACRR